VIDAAYDTLPAPFGTFESVLIEGNGDVLFAHPEKTADAEKQWLWEKRNPAFIPTVEILNLKKGRRS
jgi:hypothetical protein